jgi:hypothetical protein
MTSSPPVAKKISQRIRSERESRAELSSCVVVSVRRSEEDSSVPDGKLISDHSGRVLERASRAAMIVSARSWMSEKRPRISLRRTGTFT